MLRPIEANYLIVGPHLFYHISSPLLDCHTRWWLSQYPGSFPSICFSLAFISSYPNPVSTISYQSCYFSSCLLPSSSLSPLNFESGNLHVLKSANVSRQRMTSWGSLVARHCTLASGTGVKWQPTALHLHPGLLPFLTCSSKTPFQGLLVPLYKHSNVLLFFLSKYMWGSYLLFSVTFFYKDFLFILVFIPYLQLKARGLRIRISSQEA